MPLTGVTADRRQRDVTRGDDNAHAQQQPFTKIAAIERALGGERALRCEHRRSLTAVPQRKHRISGEADDVATVIEDQRIEAAEEIVEDNLQFLDAFGAPRITFGQRRVADDVGHQDGATNTFGARRRRRRRRAAMPPDQMVGEKPGAGLSGGLHGFGRADDCNRKTSAIKALPTTDFFRCRA